jgi:restriction system protein
MAIPDYQTIMLPLLKQISDLKEHRHRDTINALALNFKLTEDDLSIKLPSGRQAIFDNRVGWARTYLMKAGLLEYTRRGYCKITSQGLDVIRENPDIISVSYLRRFPGFQDFHSSKPSEEQKLHEQPSINDERTPGENLEYSYLILRRELAYELLQRLKASNPQFFEKVVVELLVKMGYGGSMADAGEAVGKSGDGGIDGIIKEDRLGLDVIYIQAKRWEGIVGRQEIQKFVGALQMHKARKGVFITTSGFTKEAKEYVTLVDNKVVLIDGDQLTQFMIDYNLGVSIIAVYEEKKIDQDFFSEE